MIAGIELGWKKIRGDQTRIGHQSMRLLTVEVRRMNVNADYVV